MAKDFEGNTPDKIRFVFTLNTQEWWWEKEFYSSNIIKTCHKYLDTKEKTGKLLVAKEDIKAYYAPSRKYPKLGKQLI